jgi:hypothetical protein
MAPNAIPGAFRVIRRERQVEIVASVESDHIDDGALIHTRQTKRDLLDRHAAPAHGARTGAAHRANGFAGRDDACSPASSGRERSLAVDVRPAHPWTNASIVTCQRQEHRRGLFRDQARLEAEAILEQAPQQQAARLWERFRLQPFRRFRSHVVTFVGEPIGHAFHAKQRNLVCEVEQDADRLVDGGQVARWRELHARTALARGVDANRCHLEGDSRLR